MEHFEQKVGGFLSYRQFYRYLAEWMPPTGRMVELGTAYGQGLAFLAVELINLGKEHVRLDGVDTGDVEVVRRNLAPVAHMIGCLWHECSWNAAQHYADGSLDAVFVDAAHDEQSVRRDIDAWLPKVRHGGILAGHDHTCEPGVGGVVQAVLSRFDRYTVWRGEKFGTGTGYGGTDAEPGNYYPAWQVVADGKGGVL